MSQHDQRCTPFRQNVRDLWEAAKEWGVFVGKVSTAFLLPFKRVSYTIPKGRIGHELKNVVVEEWRRWTGKCPKEDESKESGV